MVLYVATHGATNGDALWRSLAVASLLILAATSLLAFLFALSFSHRISQIRAYAERLLDPPLLEQQLPSGDDDLGLLARSLQ